MNLIEEHQRKEVLAQFGFDQRFISAVDNPKNVDHGLSYVINYPEGAYHYLPIIKNYEIYRGYNVLPICDSGQGDSFYTLLFNDSEQKIIYNEIEHDKIYANFGMNTHALIITLLIEYYDLMDDDEVEDRAVVLENLSQLGAKLGVEKKVVMNAMKRIFVSEDQEEDRFTHSRKWFELNIYPLLS